MRRPTWRVPAILLAALLACGLSACSGDEAGERAVTPSATTTSPDAVAVLLDSGLQAAAAGDTAGAREAFNSVLTLDPENVQATYNLGQLLQTEGRGGQAIDQYDAALALDPDFVPAIYNRAILLETRDLGAAVEGYERVIELDAERAPAYVRLGFALDELGETERAAEVRAQGLAIDPSLASAEPPTY